MRIRFGSSAWTDYLYWQKANAATLRKINILIEDVRRHPFSGRGKPEPLRNGLDGFSSRRINHEHRLVYRVLGKGIDQAVEIAACRFHYTR